MSMALRQALVDEDWRFSAGRQGREHSRQYTWGRTAAGLVDVFKELTG
jgi:hypothetical protein